MIANKRLILTSVLAFTVLFISSSILRANATAVWYVNGGTGIDTLDDDQGTTPERPFETIQYGIDTASGGDTVEVADGTYTGTGNKNLDFNEKAITVKSANGPEKVIIDCEHNGRGFYFHSSEGSQSVVVGFTVMNGKAVHGGAIYIYQSSPTITGCIIRNNSTSYTFGDYYGGGIYIRSNIYPPGPGPVYPVITNCVISGNKSGRRGGGIYVDGAYVTITNCTIINNSTSTDFDAWGGGIDGGGSTITNCIIRDNSPNQGSVNSSTYSNIEGLTTGEGNIDINPAFVDPVTGDFRLKDFSPCIGSGTTSGAPETDIVGNLRPNPPDTNPDMGAYENSLGVRGIPPFDLFGMAIDNQWTYDSNVQRKITTININIYEMEILENGSLIGKEWYEATNDQLLLLGSGEYLFDKGLLAAFFPLSVDEQRSSSAGVVGYPGVAVSMTVVVLSHEQLSLAIGSFDAYRLRYNLTAAGSGGTSSQTFDWWVVPYLGVIKQQTSGGEENLMSFAIGGGTITQDSDADRDNLSDYQEIFVYDTLYLNADSDGDDCLDGEEVNGGRDPKLSDPRGDLNADCALDLKDAIDALRFVELMDGTSISGTEGDVNGDGHIGLEDASFVIQKIGGLR